MLREQHVRRAFDPAAAITTTVRAISGAASAQEPTAPPSVSVADPIGDVRVPNCKTVPTPGFMDITALEVELDGDDLVATIRVAGDPAEAPTTFPHTRYTIWVSGPGTSSFSLTMVTPSAGWRVIKGFGFDWEALDTAQIQEDAIVVRVPRPELVAPEKLTFAAMMHATDLALLSEPDLFVGLSRHDGGESPAPTPAAPTPVPTMTTLEWGELIDFAPDTPSGSIVWTDFAGDTIENPSYESYGTYQAPLNSAAVTERILGQKGKIIRPPRMARFRDELKTFIQTYEATLATMPRVDGVEMMEMGDDWLELPGLMAQGNEEARSRSDRRRARTIFSSAAAAILIYVADRAPDEDLAADAERLADKAYDYAVAGIEKRKRGKIDDRQRTSVDGKIRDFLEGFTDR